MKFFLTSKTIIGVSVLFIDTLKAITGFELSTHTEIETAVEALFALIGFVITIYGRIKATGGLKFTL